MYKTYIVQGWGRGDEYGYENNQRYDEQMEETEQETFNIFNILHFQKFLLLHKQIFIIHLHLHLKKFSGINFNSSPNINGKTIFLRHN